LHSNILFHIGHFVDFLPQIFIEQLILAEKEYYVELASKKSMCIVFPYISTTLDDYLNSERVKDENGVIKLEILKKCLEDIFSALDHLTKLKIVHRDIKENNFLVDEKGNVLMIDFGEAEFYSEEDEGNTIKYGFTWGNPNYIPPEVSKSIKHLENNKTKYLTLKYDKCDIWSTSAMLYNIISPFNLEKTYEFSLDNLDPLPESLSFLQQLFNKTLEPDPKERFDTKQVLEYINQL